MLAGLLELAEPPVLRRAIVLGVSRNLLTKYNNSDGWIQHEEIRLVDYDYPAGETTGSEIGISSSENASLTLTEQKEITCAW